MARNTVGCLSNNRYFLHYRSYGFSIPSEVLGGHWSHEFEDLSSGSFDIAQKFKIAVLLTHTRNASAKANSLDVSSMPSLSTRWTFTPNNSPRVLSKRTNLNKPGTRS